MRSIGRATLPLRLAGAAGIALGVLGVLAALLLPNNMTCTSAGDCRTANDLFFAIAMLGRVVGAPFAAAGTFAIGVSLLTVAFRPAATPDIDAEPRREATMTRETETQRILAPARTLWGFAIVLFAICAAAAVFVSLPLTQIAFGASCDETGCNYSPLSTVLQIAGFLAPSVMIAALLIAVLAIVASTINRHGGIRIEDASGRARHDGHGPDDRGPDDRGAHDPDPDAELDELLGTATDELDRARSRGSANWRGGDLTPFMRPPGHDRGPHHSSRD